MGGAAAAIIMMMQAPSEANAPVDTGALIAHYREATSITPHSSASCADRRGADPDVILVCKGRDAALRLPLPDERGPIDGPRRRNGDVSTTPPGPPCPPGGCTGINLLSVPGVLYKIVEKVVDPDG